jgi:cell wall-associated NlpC family hydrolase
VRPEQLLRSLNPEFWNPTLEKEFSQIAIQAYPYEACAFVIKNKLVPVANVSKNPREQFELSTEDSLLQINAQGFVHSHPDGPFCPSGIDMLSQKSANIPYGIMTTSKDSSSTTLWVSDKNLDSPLEERPFIHGVFDCYSLIRAYYYQSRKIKLMDFPRDNEWWNITGEGKQELYLNNFEKAGFKRLSSEEQMQEGDVILMDIQSGVVSHAAIYLGNGLLLHHLRDRISRKDQAAQWKKFFHTTVRYNE